MNKQPRIVRIASAAPASRGFGFAVLDEKALIEWAVITVGTCNKNATSLKKLERLLDEYKPNLLVLFNARASGARRAKRIQDLIDEMATLARDRGIAIRRFSRPQVAESITRDGKALKLQIAEALAKVFPEALLHRLPKKRKQWNSEDPRMDMFDAVALVVTAQIRSRPRKANQRITFGLREGNSEGNEYN